MTLGSESATASAPTEQVLNWPSETGNQLSPLSVVLNTPPPIAPKQDVSGCEGTPATATERPPRNGPIWRNRSSFNKSAGCAASSRGKMTSAASFKDFIVSHRTR